MVHFVAARRATFLALALCKDQRPSDIGPVPGEDTWNVLRATYNRAVGDVHLARNGSGFHVPFEVRVTRKRGRGVFMSSHVPNGTLLWDSRFSVSLTEVKYHQMLAAMLAALPLPLVCDVVRWSYNDAGNGPTARLDLDAGALVNGVKKAGAKGRPNMRCFAASVQLQHCPVPSAAGEARRYYAVRDIAAGEELLDDYSLYVLPRITPPQGLSLAQSHPIDDLQRE
jgi:hypothetical protein